MRTEEKREGENRRGEETETHKQTKKRNET